MSLYSDIEICKGCKHAIFYECGNCLKKCLLNKEEERSFIIGFCEYYEK